MGLDLPQVVLQIERMVSRLRDREREWVEKRRLAVETLAAAEAGLEGLKRKIGLARTSWLVAGIEEGLGKGHPPPSPPPAGFAVLSTDGSHIATDRHSPAHCYLINLGVAYLRYGEAPQARLFSQPTLYWEEADLIIADPTGMRDEQVAGVVLGVKRAVEEVRLAAELAPEMASPLLVLLDGSLILWGMAGQGFPPFVREALLEQGLLPALGSLRQQAAQRPLALAGYISHPRSTDVVNALRLALCPYDAPDCDHLCRGQEKRCAALDGMEDRFLFEAVLAPGERSPLFLSASSVARQYGEHQVGFFYLKGEDEVARVEVPRWVAGEGVGLVHSLVLDQCRRGRGYPVALMEAHQQAVLAAADREGFWHLVEQMLWQRGQLPGYSPKQQSKRLPWI